MYALLPNKPQQTHTHFLQETSNRLQAMGIHPQQCFSILKLLHCQLTHFLAFFLVQMSVDAFFTSPQTFGNAFKPLINQQKGESSWLTVLPTMEHGFYLSKHGLKKSMIKAHLLGLFPLAKWMAPKKSPFIMRIWKAIQHYPCAVVSPWGIHYDPSQ